MSGLYNYLVQRAFYASGYCRDCDLLSQWFRILLASRCTPKIDPSIVTMPAATPSMVAPPKRSLSGMFQMRGGGGVQRTSSSQSTVSLGGGDMDADGSVPRPEEDDSLWLQLEGGLFGSAGNEGRNTVSPSSTTSSGKGRSWFGARKSSGLSPTGSAEAPPPTLDADQFLWDADPPSQSTPTAVRLPNVTPPHS
jgi:hypothetical protein